MPSPSRSSPLHRCIDDELGCSSSRPDSSRSLVSGREAASHRRSRDEGSSALLECLPFQESRRVGHSHEQQCHSGGLGCLKKKEGIASRVIYNLAQEIVAWIR